MRQDTMVNDAGVLLKQFSIREIDDLQELYMHTETQPLLSFS